MASLVLKGVQKSSPSLKSRSSFSASAATDTRSPLSRVLRSVPNVTPMSFITTSYGRFWATTAPESITAIATVASTSERVIGRAPRAAVRLLRRNRGRERLAGFDDVVRKHAGRCRTLVRRVVHRAGRDEERLSDTERHGRLAVLFEHDRALQDGADFFSRVRVSANRSTGLKLRNGRHGLSAGH